VSRATPVGTKARRYGGATWRDEVIADFVAKLLADWDTIPAHAREVWLRQRLDDLVDSPRDPRFWWPW
jgi:hypothetical protein